MPQQPTSSILLKRLSILMASSSVARIIQAKSASRSTEPTKPNCSANSANTKSVWASGRNPEPACEALPMPLPKNPPEPTAIFAWRRL